MSKGNMLLGQARGKVGSLVFSRSNGKQIVRSRAEVVKNPQTEKQTIQRIIMNTIAQAYSKMSAIVDHSYEGIPAGAKTMSAFMKENLNAVRSSVIAQVKEGKAFEEIYDFSPIGSNEFAPNTYVIAKGQLPAVDVIAASSEMLMAVNLPENTYQSVLETYGLQRGDQLTFVSIVRVGASAKGFKFARVILDPMDENGAELPLSTAFIADGAINKPNVRNEGTFVQLSYASSKLSFAFTGSGGVTYAAAVIVSRKKTDGTWMRSNASLAYNTASTWKEVSLQDALDDFYGRSISLLDSMYLNNSGTGALANSGTSGDGGDDEGGGGDDPMPPGQG